MSVNGRLSRILYGSKAIIVALTLAGTVVAAPLAQAENAQSPSAPGLFSVRDAQVTEQVREDSSNLPVIWAGSAADVPGLNTRLRTYLEHNGMDLYEWSPLMTSVSDPNVKILDHVKEYIPNFDAYVKKVMAETGAKKVNVITYSQGGLVAAGWMRQGKNAQLVDKVANISGVVNGSEVARICPALPGDCLGLGSYQDLNPDGEYIQSIINPTALPGIEYLNIDSRTDGIAFPYSNSLMTGPGDYTNVLTEDLCKGQFGIHLSLSFMPIVQESVVQFFRGQAISPDCTQPLLPIPGA